MIYKDILLHNVSEITPVDGGGFAFHRLPVSVEATMSEQGQRMNRFTTGVELRFKMISDKVKITLRHVGPPTSSAQVYVYHGSVLGGWDEFTKSIPGGTCREIEINKYPRMTMLWEATKAGDYEFSPEIVRLVLPAGTLELCDVEGEFEPPLPEDMPKETYLAYGSSITNGSLALNMPSTFTTVVGEHFRVDVRNLGFASSAKLERAVADEIAAMGERGEWSFATLCMGINVLRIEESDFAERVDYMIRAVAGRNPDKHIFCISPFLCEDDMEGSDIPTTFRRVVKEAVENYGSYMVHYVDGLSLMGTPAGLSGDLTHPSPIGVRMISDGLIRAIREYIPVK